MTDEIRTLCANGRVMHFAESGTGSLVVLVHGSLSDYRYWAPQMQPLAARFRVVAPSLSHHHPHSPESPPINYGVREHASDLTVFLQALGAGPAHVVGHSRGAHVCVLAALQRPDLVASLVLADPAIPLERTTSGGHDMPRESAALRKLALERIREGDVDGGLEAFIDAVSGHGVWRKLNGRRKQMARDNAATLPAQYDDPALTEAVPALSTLTMPLLLIGGEKSPPPYPGILGRLAQQWPGARKLVLAKASHAMNAEDAASFNRELIDFIDRSNSAE